MKPRLGLHQLISTMVIASFLIACWLTWATLIDGVLIRQPIVIYGDLQTDKFVYSRGETVWALIKFCKNRNVKAEFQWTIINSYMKDYAPRTGMVSVGCHETLIAIEEIPLDQIKGHAYFETTLFYKINPFNTVKIKIRTNEFIVQ